MSHFLRIFVFLLLGSNLFLAQSPPDFRLRVENSFAKLYENPDVAIHAAEEIRTEEEQLIIKDILAQAYLLKGNYLESVRISFEKSSLQKPQRELLIRLVLAREFYSLNLYEQTAKIIETAVSAKNPPQNSLWLAQLYQLQAKNFIALKDLKAAKKSISKSSNLLNKNTTATLILKENELIAANILLLNGQFGQAKKQANQLFYSLDALPRATYLFALTQQFRGHLFFEEQNYKESITCLESSLKALEGTSYEPLKNSLFMDLSKSYLVANQNEKYQWYTSRFEESSKNLESQKKDARRELIQLSSKLTAENNKDIFQKHKTQLLYLIGVSLLLISVSVYFLFREINSSKSLFKQIRFFRSLRIPYLRLSSAPIKTKDFSRKQLNIPKEKELELLEKLNQFEDSKKYLDNNMSLANLAVELETNTKYLSEIINTYKDKNFNAYINELRIKYITHLLSTDSSYLQYKISYIAEIGGFTSHSAFTNIFKSVTGMSPNEYLQTLRNQAL